MSKVFLLSVSLFLISTSSIAQKDKAIYSVCNVNNEVLVVFKSGTVALLSNPELEILKEYSPEDKKNNAQLAGISTSGKYLIVSDSKVSAWIVYDAITLEELTRIENKEYALPMFVGEDQFFLDKKILSFPDGEVLLDLTAHENKYKGYVFSPKQTYYLNYEIDGTGGNGEFEVFETATGNKIGNSRLAEDEVSSTFVIESKSGFISEDQIKIVYRTFTDTKNFQWIVPTQMGIDNFEIKPENQAYEIDNSLGVSIDYNNLTLISPEFAVDLSDDYSLYGMNACQSMSKDGNYILISTPKNKINLYRNDPNTTEKIGEKKRSTLLQSIEISKEK